MTLNSFKTTAIQNIFNKIKICRTNVLNSCRVCILSSAGFTQYFDYCTVSSKLVRMNGIFICSGAHCSSEPSISQSPKY